MSSTVDGEAVSQRRLAAWLAAVVVVRIIIWLGVGWALLAGYNAFARWTQRRGVR
jgi:hypothetical protein